MQQHKTNGGTYQYDAIGNLVNDGNEGVTITWTPYGKVRSVQKADSVTVSSRYDAAGNRIEKKVVKATSTTVTIYLRDASGNVMTIYKNAIATEVPIYGSSRIGEYKSGIREGYRILGKRNFELSNHLGNVLAVIYDNIGMKQDSVWAKVVSTNDYYPFGLEMKGRTFSDAAYRYGFNGKEKDNSFASTSDYDYGFRIYNPEIAKFLSVDPLTEQYAWYTPYQFSGNNPIRFVDVDGAEPMDPMGMRMHYYYIQKNAESVGENGFKAVKRQVNQDAKASIAGTATGVVIMAVPVAGRWVLGNWVNLIYNPIVQNEIAATIYGSVADDEWPLPAIGDNASKSLRVSYKGFKGPMEITSTLTMHKGASFANDAEKSVAIYLTKDGHNVDVVQEAAQMGQSGRSADFLVDGVKTEVKAISGVKDTTSDGISNAIKDRLSSASGQAKNSIIDLRGQKGATLEIAERGVRRYFGQSKGNTESVRVIGDGFDKIIPNKKKKN